MKKACKHMLSLILVLFLCFSTGITTFASERTVKPEDVLDISSEAELKDFAKELEKMTNEELQQVINIVSEADNKPTPSFDRAATLDISLPLKGAWLAAAQAAKVAGYRLSATLVENSVLNIDYFELNGEFASAIKKTSFYKKTSSSNRSGSSSFTKTINKDLFYSIHKFRYLNAISGHGGRLTITDVFDFEADYSYDNPFTSIVNNWAYLSQNLHALRPVNVRILIDN